MRALSLLFALAVGCVKPAPPPQAASPAPTAVATVVEYLNTTEVAGCPRP